MFTNILDEPVKKFIHKKFVMLDANDIIEKAAKIMRDEQIGRIGLKRIKSTIKLG